MLVNVEISPAVQGTIADSVTVPEENRWELPHGSCVNDVLAVLGISQLPILLVVNGKVVAEGRVLREGDTLNLFPMISGG